MESKHKKDKIKNRLIIVEGADRIGKTTALVKLTNTFREKGYTVTCINFSTDNCNSSVRHQTFIDFTKDWQKIWTIFSGNFMQMYWSITKIFEAAQGKSKKGHIVIVDRLHLSGFVFSKLLRPESLYNVWGPAGFRLLELIESFELSLNEDINFQSTLIVFTKADDAMWVDDNEHIAVKISAAQQRVANDMFKHMFAMSKMSRKIQVQLQLDDKTGLYPTYEYLLASAKLLSQV
jgi:hypothetical protein